MIDNQETKGMFSNLGLLVILLVVISVSGLLAGIIYFDIATVQTALETVNFDIPISENNSFVYNNITVNDFQDIMKIIIYPILNLKSSLPYLTYFMIFAFIIGLGMTAYLSSKNPLFFVLHILFTFVITYFCIILANMYADLLTNTFINQIMVQFTIYNKLMLYLPQIVFFTSLLFGAISFINLMKPQTSSASTSIQYGGDY